MQAFALGRQKRIGLGLAVRRSSRHAPSGCRSGHLPWSSHGARIGEPSGSSPDRSRSARSSRMAGACSRPTDGKRCSSHARLRIPGSSRLGVDAAPCARTRSSPQSPSSVHCPLPSRPIACCQPSLRRPAHAATADAPRRPGRSDDSSMSCMGRHGIAYPKQASRRAETRRPAPAEDRCRRPATSARCANIGTNEACDGASLAMRLAEGQTVQPQQQRAQRHQQAQRQHHGEHRLPREGRSDDQEFGHEDARGRQAHDRDHAQHQAPAQNRMRNRQPADVGHPLRALDLRDVADGKEDRRLGQAVIGHVQQAGEVGERPAHAEGEGDDPHVLDGRVGEHALDVVAPVQHERREQHGEQAERHHQRAGRQRAGIGRHHHLEAQHREQRDVEQQPDSTAEMGVGPSACASGSHACSGTRPTFVP